MQSIGIYILLLSSAVFHGVVFNMSSDDDDVLTPEDRRRLEAKLHRLLFWVGAEIPDEIRLECGNVNLRDTVYNFITKDSLTPEEEAQVRRLLHCLEKQELIEEERLEHAPLTRKEAEALTLELAGLLRAIMDLKELKAPRQKRRLQERSRYHRVEDAKRWMEYVKQLKKT